MQHLLQMAVTCLKRHVLPLVIETPQAISCQLLGNGLQVGTWLRK